MAEPCRRCGGSGIEPDHSEIGGRMRRCREDAGLTLREQARAMGISAAYLSDLERGNRAWSRKLLSAYEGMHE